METWMWVAIAVAGFVVVVLLMLGIGLRVSAVAGSPPSARTAPPASAAPKYSCEGPS